MKEEKRKEECKEEELGVRSIDDQNIGAIVGGKNPFDGLPHVPNAPIDEDVTENA